MESISAALVINVTDNLVIDIIGIEHLYQDFYLLRIKQSDVPKEAMQAGNILLSNTVIEKLKKEIQTTLSFMV